MTDFGKWERFNADEESARVDAAAAEEDAKKHEKELLGARDALEQAGIGIATDLAETAAAHARVAALGSSRGRGRRRISRRPAAASVDEVKPKTVTKPDDAEQLATLAQKLQNLTMGRAEATAILDSVTAEQRDKTAQSGLEKALASFQELLSNIADVECLLAQEEAVNKMSTEGNDTATHEEHYSSIKGGRDLSSSSSLPAIASSIATESGFSTAHANDAMRTTVRSVRFDVLRGLGLTQLRLGRYAEASDSLKALLMIDPDDVLAWQSRGDAFKAMGVPTLAELHYEQVKGKATKSPLTLEASGPAASSQNQNLPSLSDSMQIRARRLAMEGLVIFKEQFFASALRKFEEAAAITKLQRRRLLCLLQVSGVVNDNTTSMAQLEIKRWRSLARLLEMEMSCRLNAASCCLIRQQDYDTVESHCSEILEAAEIVPRLTELSSSNKVKLSLNWAYTGTTKAFLRRAEARRCVGFFEGGDADLAAARKLNEERYHINQEVMRAGIDERLEEMRHNAKLLSRIYDDDS